MKIRYENWEYFVDMFFNKCECVIFLKMNYERDGVRIMHENVLMKILGMFLGLNEVLQHEIENCGNEGLSVLVDENKFAYVFEHGESDFEDSEIQKAL